jgi:hypothetical protein
MQQGDWVAAAVELMKEVYDGPVDPKNTWFVDNEPRAGILGTLAQVTAAQASARPSVGRSTLAGHASHLRYSLHSANAYARDIPLSSHWNASWDLQEVNEEQWADLRADLRTQFNDVMLNLQTAPLEDQEVITGYLSLVGHAAYHLGAIRTLAASYVEHLAR